METRANYLLIGAFTLVVAVLALLFGLWTVRFSSGDAWNHYTIRFTESVTGLTEGSSVLYNGVDVGRVRTLGLDRDDPREVVARVQIESHVPVRQDTVATIRLTGLTGMAAIQLSGGSPDSPPLQPGPDQEWPEIQSQASPLHRLMESSEGIAATANKILLQIDTLLAEENIDNVARTLQHLEQITAALGDKGPEVSQLLDDVMAAGRALPELVRQTSGTLQRLDRMIVDVDDELIAALPGMREDLAGALESFATMSARLDTIVAGNEQALLQLGDTGLRQVGAGLEDLRRLIRDLSNLIRTLEQNPSRLLLGGDQPEEYQPQ